MWRFRCGTADGANHLKAPKAQVFECTYYAMPTTPPGQISAFPLVGMPDGRPCMRRPIGPAVGLPEWQQRLVFGIA